MTPERLRRFFKKHGETYKVDRQPREMVVFAIHDITRDPPLSRLDMISCRNLLIYMDPALQKKVIPLFYYGLVDQGILFLGTSEGVGDFHDLFETVDKKFKVFRARKIDPLAYRSHVALFAKMPEVISREGKVELGDVPETTSQEVNIRRLVEQIILQKYAPPGVLVDDPFLRFWGGQRQFDFLDVSDRELRLRNTAAKLLYLFLEPR